MAAVLAAGCATQVAVGPANNQVATYHWGTLTGLMQGDPDSLFRATNHALDDLKYFRVYQEVSKDKKDILVVARGVLDQKVTVHITPAKDEGMNTVAISVGDGDLPKSQALFSAIERNIGGGGSSSGLNSPSRP